METTNSAGSRTRTPWKTLLEVVTSVFLLAAALAVLWVVVSSPQPRTSPTRPEVPLPTELQALAGAQLKGSLLAPVALIAYSDFQCPFCGRFARDTFPDIERLYINPGKVVFAFRHSPIERIHPLAVKASEAAECAGRQGRFWEMHDALFLDGATLDPPGLLRAATNVGLDVPQNLECLAQDGSARIRADRATAEALQLKSTPAFLVGLVETGGVRVTRVLRGARPFPEFAAVLDDLLARLGG